MQSVLILNLSKEATMSLSRIRFGWALAAVVVLAAALVPVAGASSGGGSSRRAPGTRTTPRSGRRSTRSRPSAAIEPTSPWYAYDAALRKAQHQRHQQSVGFHFITDTLGGNGGGPVANQPN